MLSTPSSWRRKPRLCGRTARRCRRSQVPSAARRTIASTRLTAVDAGLCGVIRTSPRTPWVLTMRPISTNSVAAVGLDRAAAGRGRPPDRIGGWLRFLDDLEHHFAVGAGGGRIQDGADRFRGAALLANDPAEVFLRHFELQHGGRVALGLLHLHCFRMIDEMLREELDQFFHGVSPATGSRANCTPLCFISCATAALGLS